MSQILRKWIADNAINEAKIDSAALGNGLEGGSGTVLSVKLGTGLAFGDGGVINVTSTVTDDLSTALQAEIDRATAAETALDTRLTTAESDIDALEGRATALETRMTTAESDIDALETALAAEVTRATNAESALDTRLTTAESDIDALETALAQEASDRAAADTTLQGNIDTVATNLQSEIDRATAAEAAIKTNVAAAIVDAVEGAKVEVMYALTAADITATSFTIPGTDVPASAGVVEITPVGGIKQINAANVGTSGATADFSVAGSVVTLAGSIWEEGDVLMISFIKDTTVTIA